jgi:hypothetical protein
MQHHYNSYLEAANIILSLCKKTLLKNLDKAHSDEPDSYLEHNFKNMLQRFIDLEEREYR